MVKRAPIIAVFGPPGSGKTTYVQEHKRENAPVWDWDRVHHALTGATLYHTNPALVPLLSAMRNAYLDSFLTATQIAEAWYISSDPSRAEHDRIKRKYQAHVIVLEVDTQTCLDRIKRAGDRVSSEEEYREAVSRWWVEYGGAKDRKGQIVPISQ